MLIVRRVRPDLYWLFIGGPVARVRVGWTYGSVMDACGLTVPPSRARLALAKVDRIRRNSDAEVHAHAALVELLEAGDVEAAAAELERHLAHAETSLLAALDQT